MARLTIAPDGEEEIGRIVSVLLPHLRAHPDLLVGGPTTASHQDGGLIFEVTLIRHDETE